MRIGSYLFLSLLLWASCSSTKHLQEGESVYVGSSLRFKNAPKTANKKALVYDLTSQIKPLVPNKAAVGVYNLMGTPKKQKGIRHWIKNKLGKAPIIYDKRIVERNSSRLTKYLKDNGYFDAAVNYQIKEQQQKVKVQYELTLNEPYFINQIILPYDSSRLSRLISLHQQDNFLKKGAQYQRQNLELERQRLATIANSKGLMDFNANYLYYYVDTTKSQRLADIYLKITAPPTGKRHQVYHLDQTYIIPDYKLNQAANPSARDTLNLEKGMQLIQHREVLKPEVFDRVILQRANDLLSKKIQDISINHLLDLGVFKFVNLKYQQKKDEEDKVLDRYLYLTPDQIAQFSTELELNNQTGNYFGTAATFTYSHKNLFHGAERLDVSLSGGLETQIGRGLNFLNSADFNIGVGLTIPQLLLPFASNLNDRQYLPKTSFALSNTFQRRIEFYTLNALNFKFGYTWRKSANVQHELYPINISRINLSNPTPAFDTLLMQNNRIRESFESSSIAGLSYTFTYSNQNSTNNKSYTFLKAEVETSGNLLYLTNSLFSTKTNQPYTFLNTPFSQYVKVSADLRRYLFKRETALVARLYVGVAKPYGNVRVLPYTEQFFIGGSNSLRAFRVRALGSGSFQNPEANSSTDLQFIDQTGDLKLEGNLEYRFPIMGYLKGAFFVDAGNIWLFNSETQPEGIFQFNRFYREIAVGTGFGFRFDFDYFVLRLDAAFPLRRPVGDMGFQWVLKDVQLGNKDWRGDNLRLNLGIGYPF